MTQHSVVVASPGYFDLLAIEDFLLFLWLYRLIVAYLCIT